MNTFGKCLNYEKSMQLKADHFYSMRFGCNPIRYDYNGYIGKTMQNKDIDISLPVNGYKNGYCNISEKYRSFDYGDMMVELYSNYEIKKQGWGMKGASDYVFYFTPKQTYIVNSDQLKDITERVHRRLFNNFQRSELLDKLIKLGSVDTTIQIYPYQDSTNITLYKIPTLDEENNVKYNGICYCITWEDLEKLGVEITKKPTIF